MLKEIQEMIKKLSVIHESTKYEIGTVPGSIDVKHKELVDLEIEHIRYNSEVYEEISSNDVPELKEINDSDRVDLLFVNGFGDEEFVKKIENNLELHKLSIEDILNSKQPPKLEFFDTSLFLILRLVFPEDENRIDRSISLVVYENALFVFSPFNKFTFSKKVIQRIAKKRGIIRDRGVDYLLFAIIDIVIDSYFPKVEMISNSIKEIDQILFDEKKTHLLREIKAIRQVLNIYFDNLYPLKDILTRIKSEDYNLIKENNLKYYNNCQDHVNYLCERINRLKESTSDIMNLSISMNGQKMNEIMKLLTMMSSIFIPLSFICGLYGMNFDTSKSKYNMPELSFAYGYPIVVSVMATLVVFMLIYFYRKKWI